MAGILARRGAIGRVAHLAAFGLHSLCVLVPPLPTMAADAPFQLERDTALDVYAVGIPDFRFRVVVDDEGKASFPLLEPMQVEGMTLDEVRGLLKTQLPTRVYRQRGADGVDNLINILPEEIVVEVAEYPPVYVTGDVATAGRVAFRPGMTAREAIALAGGFDPTRSRAVDPVLEAATIRSDIASAWIDQASLQARRLGLEAQLAGKPISAEIFQPIAAPLSPAMIRDVVTDEITRLQALEDDYQRELAHVRELIGTDETELTDLETEYATVQERLKEQDALAAQMKEGLQSGLVTGSRYGEERRDAFYMRAQALALSGRISDLKRDRSELERRLQSSQDKRRADWLAALQDTRLRQEALDAKIASLQDKSAYVDGAGIGLSTAGGLRASITVHHRAGDAVEARGIDEDARIASGDVVEVTLLRPTPWEASGSFGQPPAAPDMN